VTPLKKTVSRDTERPGYGSDSASHTALEMGGQIIEQSSRHATVRLPLVPFGPNGPLSSLHLTWNQNRAPALLNLW